MRSTAPSLLAQGPGTISVEYCPILRCLIKIALMSDVLTEFFRMNVQSLSLVPHLTVI